MRTHGVIKNRFEARLSRDFGSAYFVGAEDEVKLEQKTIIEQLDSKEGDLLCFG
jgi:hypothetical protein